MRVIAGKHRGRVLKEFKGREIRPTSDRAKEALFNILQFDIAGCAFLDLYSGTGGIGIEAISRGAEKVVFVDNSEESIKLLKENLKYLKEEAEVVRSDAAAYIACSRTKFDFIFLDPPYETPLLEKSLAYISDAECLTKDGVIVAETLREKEMPEEVGNLIKTKSYAYGQVALHIYRRKEENI